MDLSAPIAAQSVEAAQTGVAARLAAISAAEAAGEGAMMVMVVVMFPGVASAVASVIASQAARVAAVVPEGCCCSDGQGTGQNQAHSKDLWINIAINARATF